jgi:hypothetical protein
VSPDRSDADAANQGGAELVGPGAEGRSSSLPAVVSNGGRNDLALGTGSVLADPVLGVLGTCFRVSRERRV